MLYNQGTLSSFIAKLTTTGTWQWQWAVSANASQILWENSLALSPDGNLYVAGNFAGLAAFGSITLSNPTNFYRGFLARLGPTTTERPDAVASATSLTLAPNPARRTVRLTGTPSPTATLTDALGRVVRTWAVPASGELELTGLPAGLYTVRAGAAARRLVVE